MIVEQSQNGGGGAPVTNIDVVVGRANSEGGKWKKEMQRDIWFLS